ncbi:MAG UNVERIFIED_CONTAM: outer membrane beta-barrel protein [Rickettsiaceae bacterium]|jgi:opacity protein-like surface antigen
MKKVLLTTAAIAALANPAFADMDGGADTFYLRADVVGSKFNKIGGAKSKFNNLGLDVGAGYRVMDNMRVELVYNHLFEPTFKSTEDANNYAKVKVSADAVMLRGLVDFADLGMAKLYAGAGLGWSKVRGKASGKLLGVDVSGKTKSSNNLAWSVHFGSGFAVADGVNLDLGYSYRDYGKVGKKADSDKGRLRGHNVSAGVRFDI